MNDIDTPIASPAPPPHPLAQELAHVLTPFENVEHARILLLGFGSGRNLPALLATGARVVVVDDRPERAAAAAAYPNDPRIDAVHAPYDALAPKLGSFDAALATHALLHGTLHHIQTSIDRIHAHLIPRAPFFCTLGTTSDARFGTGTRIDDHTFAPLTGSEAGVHHTYLDRDAVHRLLKAFTTVTLDDHDASTSAGTWSHTPTERESLRHWFIRAYR